MLSLHPCSARKRANISQGTECMFSNVLFKNHKYELVQTKTQGLVVKLKRNNDSHQNLFQCTLGDLSVVLRKTILNSQLILNDFSILCYLFPQILHQYPNAISERWKKKTLPRSMRLHTLCSKCKCQVH